MTYSVGDIIESYNYGAFKILEVKGYKYRIEFLQTGFQKWCERHHIDCRHIKDRLSSSSYGGVVGESKYKKGTDPFINEIIRSWSSVLSRCHNKRRYPNYSDVTVCSEWLMLENFGDWFSENHPYKSVYSSNACIDLCLDKDFVVYNNKVYSPKSCCFLPYDLNVSLNYRNNRIRDDLPTGVSYFKKDNNYRARLSGWTKYNKDPIVCFGFYKERKEMEVKEAAALYYFNGIITEQVYENFMNIRLLPFPNKVGKRYEF